MPQVGSISLVFFMQVSLSALSPMTNLQYPALLVVSVQQILTLGKHGLIGLNLAATRLGGFVKFLASLLVWTCFAGQILSRLAHG